MCLLRYENLSDDLSRLQYIRQKTGKPFNLKVSRPLIATINSLKTFDASNRKDFIFPVLKLDDDPEKYVIKINNRRLKINKYLKIVAKDLDISSISIYSARHTQLCFGRIQVLQQSPKEVSDTRPRSRRRSIFLTLGMTKWTVLRMICLRYFSSKTAFKLPYSDGGNLLPLRRWYNHMDHIGVAIK